MCRDFQTRGFIILLSILFRTWSSIGYMSGPGHHLPAAGALQLQPGPAAARPGAGQREEARGVPLQLPHVPGHAHRHAPDPGQGKQLATNIFRQLQIFFTSTNIFHQLQIFLFVQIFLYVQIFFIRYKIFSPGMHIF